MNGPNRIYLQLLDENGEPSSWATWCKDRIHDTDVEYVTAERLHLLEAVAKAAAVEAKFRYGIGLQETFTEWIGQYGCLVANSKLVLLKALDALEALEEKEQL